MDNNDAKTILAGVVRSLEEVLEELVMNDLIAIEPKECPPTSVPDIRGRIALYMAKMYKRDILKKCPQADLKLWDKLYSSNLAMSKWYMQQIIKEE